MERRNQLSLWSETRELTESEQVRKGEIEAELRLRGVIAHKPTAQGFDWAGFYTDLHRRLDRRERERVERNRLELAAGTTKRIYVPLDELLSAIRREGAISEISGQL